jgi:DNA polymerase-3 subunit beta
MRFTIDKEQFLKGLTMAGHAIGAKSTAPVLLCYKLELTSKGLEITASNSDIAVWTYVPYVVGDKETIRNGALGGTCLSAHILSELVRKCEGNELTLEIIDNVVAKLEDGKSSFKLNCISMDEYPSINFEKSGNNFTLSCADLATIVNQTGFAALTKDTRPILQAINLKAEAGRLTATATDSARLSRKAVAVDPDLRFNVNIPSKTLADIVHMFEGNEEVEISASNENVLFSFGQTLVSSPLIVGDYPASAAIIPTTFNYYLEVNSAQLLGALDRVGVLSVNSAPVVELSMEEDNVEVFSKSDQTGSGTEKLTTIQFTGERLRIAFNPVFVSQAVQALGCEDVLLSFIGEMKPFVIKNPKDDSVVEVVTPMRTR